MSAPRPWRDSRSTIQAYYTEDNDETDMEEIGNAQSETENYAEDAGPIIVESAVSTCEQHRFNALNIPSTVGNKVVPSES